MLLTPLWNRATKSLEMLTTTICGTVTLVICCRSSLNKLVLLTQQLLLKKRKRRLKKLKLKPKRQKKAMTSMSI